MPDRRRSDNTALIRDRVRRMRYPWTSSWKGGSASARATVDCIPHRVRLLFERYPTVTLYCRPYPKELKRGRWYNYHTVFPEWGKSKSVQLFSGVRDETLARLMIFAMVVDPRLRDTVSINMWVGWFSEVDGRERARRGDVWLESIEKNIESFSSIHELKHMVKRADENTIREREWVSLIR